MSSIAKTGRPRKNTIVEAQVKEFAREIKYTVIPLTDYKWSNLGSYYKVSVSAEKEFVEFMNQSGVKSVKFSGYS